MTPIGPGGNRCAVRTGAAGPSGGSYGVVRIPCSRPGLKPAAGAASRRPVRMLRPGVPAANRVRQAMPAKSLSIIHPFSVPVRADHVCRNPIRSCANATSQ